MHPHELIHKYYADLPDARRVLLHHSGQVARLARRVARNINDQTVDVDFVTEAAWLHDIGMLHTHVPEFGCTGKAHYLCHGILGAEILIGEDLPRHALVCERHIGVGLSEADIREQQLPLPIRDMRPQSIEEEIVAYADLFFSKKKDRQKTPDEVRYALDRHGESKVATFDVWHARFGL